VLVTAIEARPLRSLDRLRIELEPGIVSMVGPNGVGKTNLVEALYFALTGRSFRTSDRRDLIPFGQSLARAEATGSGTGCSPRSAAPREGATCSTATLPIRRPSPATDRRWRCSPPIG